MTFWRRPPPASEEVGGGFKVHYRKRSLWKQIKPIARVGVPFFGMMAIGTYYLYRVSQGRMEVRDRHRGAVTHQSMRKETKPFSLEEEYEVGGGVRSPSWSFLTRKHRKCKRNWIYLLGKTNEFLVHPKRIINRFKFKLISMQENLNAHLVRTSKKSTPMEGAVTPTQPPQQTDERRRFLMELEFVQCLANPLYLNYLAQSNYFSNPAFINYLRYLLYWQQPEYIEFIRYPHCLHFLVLLQSESFREKIADSSFAHFVCDQQMAHWRTYRKNRIPAKESAETKDDVEMTDNTNQ